MLPQLQPGDVIVIDNASFHHSQTIEELVTQAVRTLVFTALFSSLNEIEHWWFVLKNWMRQRWDEFVAFVIVLMLPLKTVLTCLRSATASDQEIRLPLSNKGKRLLAK